MHQQSHQEPPRHRRPRAAVRRSTASQRGRTSRVPRSVRVTRVVTAAVLVGLALAGALGLSHQAPGPPVGSPASPTADPAPTTHTAASSPSRSAPATPSSGPVSTPASTTFPQAGAGTFTRAGGGTRLVGRGRPMRYAVDVEDGIGQDPRHFAEQVDAVLDDTARGWAAGGQWAFQRVSAGPVDFTVHLASPHTTDVICGRYGLDTGGWVNCSGGPDVVINIKRWLLLTPYYRGRPGSYHALAINHEVGHRLGHQHESCPGAGLPAPVMMQQIKGLHGCVINGWPYDGHGRAVTGPRASAAP